MTERRRFSGSERAALYLAADGRCTECGRELEPGWHADHVEPWSRGGKTDVINGQALCPECNLRKGNGVSDLRRWQSRALRELGAWAPQEDEGYLIEATPGAGKTRVAIEAARNLLAIKRISRIVVAVPTARLEAQWSEAFAEFGINIMPDWHASNGVLPSDEHGCAATYAEIANSAQSFRRLCSQSTLVILDEVHHCADGRSWGAGVRTAFEPAPIKLLLSGTPFRSDNNAIPFVNYVDGTGVPDFRYGYKQALADQVVRAVFFPRRGGRMEWSYGTTSQAYTFDDALNDKDANRRLRTAISPRGQWLPSVLGDADRQLAELRESDPSAGGIVFCEESNDARAVVAMLATLGHDAVLAISNEPKADDRIKQFRDSRAPWLVSIRKVSEGVDIPRLRVGVYATPYLTEMFFRQVVGRLVRRRPDEDDPTSYLFIPDDERLRAMAQEIKDDRDHVLNEQSAELGGGDDQREWKPSLFTPISSVAEDRGMIVDSDTVTPGQIAEAERLKLVTVGGEAVPTAVLAQILKNAGLFDQAPPRQTAGDEPKPAAQQRDRKNELSQANNTTARRIVIAHGLEYGFVNGTLNRMVGVTKLKQCSVDQLELRLRYASQWLETGDRPAVDHG